MSLYWLNMYMYLNLFRAKLEAQKSGGTTSSQGKLADMVLLAPVIITCFINAMLKCSLSQISQLLHTAQRFSLA